MPGRPAVAIFDVDGTILRSESWPLFLKSVIHTYRRFVFAHAWLWVVQRFSRSKGMRAKRKQIDLSMRWIVSRLSADELANVTDRFLDDVLRTQLRPGAIDHLIQRRKAGDRIIFACSGFDFYVGPIAARLGGADVVATQTLNSVDGRILPRLDGLICTGGEKLRRVKALFADSRRPPFIRAYSTDEADFALLAWADAGTAVNPQANLADEAQALGLSVVDWSFGANDAPVRAPRMPVSPSILPSEPSQQRE
ncbi:MAG: HAD-IB family phosphatase [Pseudomonadota bacterium]